MKKNKKKTILFTCAGGNGPIYLARKLKNRFNIVLADANDKNVAPYVGFKFVLIPFGNSLEFPTTVGKIIKKYKVDYVVPGSDEELVPVIKLAKDIGLFVPISPDLKFTQTCLNKKNLMDVLQKSSISELSYFKKITNIKYPVIMKPVFGRGSREVHKVYSREQLDGYLKLYKKDISDVLIQKYIDGVEYTVSVIVNNLNKIIGIVPKKIIEKRGITKSAVTEDNKIIKKVCEKIVSAMNPRGPFNVQLKLFLGKVYVFEINPRLSTTSVLTEKAFGNEVDLCVKYYDKKNIMNLPKMKAPVYLYRYEENIFK